MPNGSLAGSIGRAGGSGTAAAAGVGTVSCGGSSTAGAGGGGATAGFAAGGAAATAGGAACGAAGVAAGDGMVNGCGVWVPAAVCNGGGGWRAAGSSEMIWRIDARISSIVGSPAFSSFCMAISAAPSRTPQST